MTETTAYILLIGGAAAMIWATWLDRTVADRGRQCPDCGASPCDCPDDPAFKEYARGGRWR